MSWGQFNDPLSYPCLSGALVTFLSYTQEDAGSNNHFL